MDSQPITALSAGKKKCPDGKRRSKSGNCVPKRKYRRHCPAGWHKSKTPGKRAYCEKEVMTKSGKKRTVRSRHRLRRSFALSGGSVAPMEATVQQLSVEPVVEAVEAPVAEAVVSLSGGKKRGCGEGYHRSRSGKTKGDCVRNRKTLRRCPEGWKKSRSTSSKRKGRCYKTIMTKSGQKKRIYSSHRRFSMRVSQMRK